MFRTVGSAVKFRGVGLHSGRSIAATVAPAPAGAGIVFHRTDAGASARPIPARFDRVSDTLYCTGLSNEDGLAVGTVEHLMAAFAGCGITDVSVHVDGREIPAMDGSAVDFVRGLLRAGFRDRGGAARAIRILRPVCVHVDGRLAALLPAPRFEMEFTVRFTDPAIGRQSKCLVLTPRAIIGELCDSRTFGCLRDVETLRAMGLCRGGALENAIVVDRGRVLNPGGLRHPDEFVRHKMLDAVGDLALAGAPIIGRYIGFKAGHEMTNLLLRKLFTQPTAWAWYTAPDDAAPGPSVEAPLPPAAKVTAAV